MARIRTIKPEFFTSEDIVSMSPLARLFYVSLWCEADREGRFEWKPKTFKLRYLPGDNCDMDMLSSELIDAGLVILYQVEGKTYAEIPTFKKHQVINNRESDSEIPARVPHASSTRQARVSVEGKEGRERKEECAKPQSVSPPTPLESEIEVMATIPLVDKTEFQVTREMVDEWTQSFPAVDVVASLLRMRTWSNANPANKKTARGVSAFIVRWLGKEQDNAARIPGRQSSSEGMFAGAI
jgi:hypothetical protein